MIPLWPFAWNKSLSLSLYIDMHICMLISWLGDSNENKNSKYKAQNFNKHSYTKGSPEHNFICQSGSYAGLPWSHAQTCTFSLKSLALTKMEARIFEHACSNIAGTHVLGLYTVTMQSDSCWALWRTCNGLAPLMLLMQKMSIPLLRTQLLKIVLLSGVGQHVALYALHDARNSFSFLIPFIPVQFHSFMLYPLSHFLFPGCG